MIKALPFLLILAFPGTCSSQEEADGANEVASVPQDSLDSWVLRSPPHVVDLAMWFFPAGDTAGVVPWQRLLSKEGPITWRESKPQTGKGGWKGVTFLNGSCTIVLEGKDGRPATAKAFILVKGDKDGAKQIGLNSGYDRNWGGRFFEPALWMDVDTARYELMEEWENEMDGKTVAFTYQLELPGRPRLQLTSGNSCGFLGCDYRLVFERLTERNEAEARR